MCATNYKLGLLIAIFDVISCIYTWHFCQYYELLCSGFSIVAQCHNYQNVCLAFFKGPDRCKSESANLKLCGKV